MKGRIFREKDGFSFEFVKVLFAVRAAGVDQLRHMPVEIRPRSDDVAVHGPVVVLAEGEAVGGVVVVGFRKRDEVGGVDEGDVISGRQADTEAAGGALMVVDLKDLAPEGGAATVFEGLVCDER